MYKSKWSEWDVPKGFQPVADEVVVEYVYKDDNNETSVLKCKAGDLGWNGLGGGMISYRYQIVCPEYEDQESEDG